MTIRDLYNKLCQVMITRLEEEFAHLPNMIDEIKRIAMDEMPFEEFEAERKELVANGISLETQYELAMAAYYRYLKTND